MKSRYIIIIFLFSFFHKSFAQTIVASQDCNTSDNVCSDAGVNFVLAGGGSGSVNDLPFGLNISNPGFGQGPNNGNPNSSGCLNSNENNPNWFVINVSTAGQLEFVISGTPGYYDWALWPYYENSNGTSACNDITGNSLAPVACNWNSSSAGLTGMTAPGNLPPGAVQGNFEYALNVNPGDQFVLCFSNFSGVSGSAVLQFGNDISGNTNPNSASVTCTPSTPDQTICLGESATVDINFPNVISPTYNWLVTNNVSNTTSGTGVIVSPSQTTTYIVEITENAGSGGVFYDTFDIIVVNPPAPNAGQDDQYCLGNPISLTGIPSDNGNNTFWTSNTSGISPAPSVNYTPNSANNTPNVNVNQTGDYFFIFNEDNGICPIERDTVLITVSELNISASFVEPSCGGYSDGSISINAPSAIQFSFDGGLTWNSNSTQNGISGGTYIVCGRTALGCEKCVNVNVTDPIPIVVSVSNDTLICQNGTAYLSASATGGNSYIYHWDFTGSTSANQSVNPTVDTYYPVVAESEMGCLSEPDSIHVTLRDPLSGIISLGDTVCPTYSTDLFASVIGGIGAPYTFVWSSGDTQTGPNNHTITVTPPATTTYTVTITDECETSPLVMNVDVRVAPLPVPSYTVLNPYQCEPAIFDIVNTTDSIMSQNIYWLVDGEQQFFNQDTIQTEEFWGGDYDIQMIATSYEGCVDSLTFTDALHVEYVPEANFNFSPSPVTMYNTTVFMQNQSFNAVGFDWYFTDGFPMTSTQEHVQVRFPEGETGEYEVTLIVSSALGCTDTITKIVSVQPEVIIYAPNTFTPDGDAFNQTWKVFMEGIDPYNFELLIMNRWGEVVWESHDITIGWDGTFNGQPVQAGTYVWTVQTKNINDDGKVRYNGHLNILR